MDVPCPTCRKRGPWLDQPFGPFCSRRCRLIDLGKWFAEEHQISEPLRPEHFRDAPETPEPPPFGTPEPD